MAPIYHPRVEALIRDLLAWPALRPVQQQAAAPILAGQHTLIMAATAGGKTEAAAFAWLSRALADPTGNAAAIWICPTRALATQLFERLDALCSAVGFTLKIDHKSSGRTCLCPFRRGILVRSVARSGFGRYRSHSRWVVCGGFAPSRR